MYHLRAQNLDASAAYESTIVGGQYSASLGYHTKKRLMFYPFYQIQKNRYEVKVAVNTELYGVEFCIPAASLKVQRQLHAFFAEARGGVLFLFQSSRSEFDETQAPKSGSISFGVSCGTFKNLRINN